MDLFVGEMRPDDWEAVRAIYAAGIAAGQATFETEPPSWEQWDAGHLAACRLCARAGGRVVGWAALSPVSQRAVYSGVAEVSVYVDPEHQGRGVGTALLRAVIAASEVHGIRTLQGSTFPENYDMVLSTSRFTVPECADLIVEALRRLQARGMEERPKAP